MQTPEPLLTPRRTDDSYGRGETGIWSIGGRLAWIAGLVLLLSSFTGWYSGEQAPDGITVSVIGWHTGVLGKLVFFVGLALIVLAVLREVGVELPPMVPESLVVIALGSLATIFVLVRLIDIPDEFFFAGRAIGLWIALVAALAVIAAGLLEASEEL